MKTEVYRLQAKAEVYRCEVKGVRESLGERERTSVDR